MQKPAFTLAQLDPNSTHFVAKEAIDLSATTLARLKIDPEDFDALEGYIFNGKLRFGGYTEKRSLYDERERFDTGETRNIHLGIDLWWHADTPIFSPLDGEIVVLANNASDGDYGPTIITRHLCNGESIHALFGHLRRDCLDKWKVGEKVKQGQILAHIGNQEENGGWLPHLHFQLIYNLEGNTTDYPGVCSEKELKHYLANCPNPRDFLGL